MSVDYACLEEVNSDGAGLNVGDQDPVIPLNWVVTLYYAAFITPEDRAQARAIEESGSLDFWKEEPDLYGKWMMLTRGDICLIPYPFSDRAAAKLRPTLVLQGFGAIFLALTDGRHSPAGLQAVFLPLTSKIQPGAYNVVLEESAPSFPATGLKVGSTILCWNIHTIHKGYVQKTIGRLDGARMAEVEEKLRQVLGL